MPDNFITVEKFRDLVRGAPQGTNPEDLLGDLEDMGYEIEGYNAEYSVLETVKNVPSSMVELGKGIVQFLGNPFKAVDTIGQVGLGALEKLIPGEQSSEKVFDAVKDMYVQRYGSVDKALNTIEQDPAGFLSDLSVLTGGGAAAAKVGGAVLKSSKLLTAGEKIARFSRAIDPGIQTLNAARKFNKATGFTKTLTSPIRKAAKHSSMKFAATGTEIPEKVEAIVATQQGINEVGAKLISEHGIHGTYKQMLDQSKYIAEKSKGLVDDLLADIDIKTKSKTVPKLVNEIKNKIDSPNLSDEMSEVIGRLDDIKAKNETIGLTLSEANELKRISDKFIDAFNDMGQPKTSAKNFANLRGELQHHIETVAVDTRIPTSKRVPNLAKLNKQTQSWNELAKVFDYYTKTTRPYDKIKLLTEYAVTGGILGALSGGLPKVGLFMPFMGIITARHLLRLPQVRTYLASAMQLLSEGEFRALEGGLRNPAEIGKALPVIKKLNSGFKMMLPEWRASGVITGELDAQIRAAEFEENKRKAASRAGKKRKSIYKQ